MQNSNNLDINLKSKSIDLIAEDALRELENSTEFASTPDKVQRVFARWNEILHQQLGAMLLVQENHKHLERLQPESDKVKCLEAKLTTYLKDASTLAKFQEVAKASLFTQVESYLTTYAKIEQTFQKNWAGSYVQENELLEIVKSSNFPLTAPLDKEGNTLLHKLIYQGFYDAAELLVQKCPFALDVPNDAFHLPLKERSFFNQTTLKNYIEERKKGLDWAKEQPDWTAKHPNEVMLWLEQAINDGKMADSTICDYLQNFPSSLKGQRGKNMLYCAVLGGRLPIVHKLLDLGVSPNGVYGLPLSEMSYANTTPLQHAIAYGYADIVSVLLERGADLPMPELCNFGNADVHRVIGTKISINEREQLRQTIFKKAVLAKNWPDAFRLLKEGLVPTGIELRSWALEALNQRQYPLVRLLVERGFLEVTANELATAINDAPLAWSVWFVSQMVKNDLDLNFLLELAVQKRNYPLAAFLISLGADPAKAGALQIPLAHYALQLQKGTQAEKNLRSLIHAKNVAHFVGDPVIKNMRGDNGEKLEGSQSSESIAFFSACLDFMQQEHPELADPQFLKVCKQMKHAEEIALRIGSFQSLTNDVSIAAGIKHLEDDLLAEIDQLPIGEAIVIPAGWLSGDIGHAILLECKRTSDRQLTLNVINTGDGIEYHGYGHDGARTHVNTIKTYSISIDQLKEKRLLCKLMEPKAVATEKRRYFSVDFYGALERYCKAEVPVTSSSEMQKPRKAQMSGTCSLRCLLAYAKQSLEPPVYKRMKELLSGKVMQFALEQNKLLLKQQPAFSKLLSMAAPHVFDNFIKQLLVSQQSLQDEEKILAELTAFKKELQNALPKQETENKKIPSDDSFPVEPFFKTHTIDLPNTSSSGTDTNNKKIDPAPFPAIDLQQLNSVATLEGHLQTIAACLKNQTDQTYIMRYLRSTLLTLGRHFLIPEKKGSPLANVFLDLKNDSEACERVVAQLDLLASKLLHAEWEVGGRLMGGAYSHEVSKYQSNLADYAALQYAFIIGRQLSIQIEEKRNYPAGGRIKDYGCAFLPNDLNMQTLRSRLSLNAEIEADLRQLIQYAEQVKREDNLFDFSMQKGNYDTRFSLKKRPDHYMPDFKYAAEHAKKHTDWTSADKDYDQATSEISAQRLIPDVDKEEWRIHWLYAYGMPAHVQHLRRLAFLAWMVPPQGDPTSSLSDKMPALKLVTYNDKRTDDNKVHSYPTMEFFDAHEWTICGKKWMENTGLPEQADSLVKKHYHVGNIELIPCKEQSETVVYNRNIQNRELMSIRHTVCSSDDAFFNPLTVPMLLDYFGPQHVNELGTLQKRHFFEATLFAALRLPLAIKKLPDCGKELNDFFHMALNHFEDKIATSVELSSSLEAAAFLATQWQRALVYLEQDGVGEIENESITALLEKARAKIRELLKEPKLEDEDVRQNLLLALIDSYYGGSAKQDSLAYHVVTSMATYWKSVQTKQRSGKLFPAFIESASSLPIQKQEAIKKSLSDPEAAKKTLDAVAELYNIQILTHEVWNGERFPVYTCQTTRGLLEINVLTGRFLKDKLELTLLPEDTRRLSESYRELFGEASLPVIDCVDYLQAEDPFGTIRIFIPNTGWRQISQIHRLIGNQWYCHIPAKEKTAIPPFSILKDLTIWYSTSKPTHYLYVDRKTMQPVMRLDLDGRITLLKEQPVQSWEWVNMQTLDLMTDLHALDVDAFILQAVTEKKPRPMLLQFPHLKDENGHTLTFERREVPQKGVRWVVRNRPHLMLAHEQRLPGLRGFNNFILLENTNGALSALIPIKTKETLNDKKTVDTSCIHANIKDEAIAATEPKGNAYLAYLALTHAITPEDYQLALAFLKKARKFERYTAEELRLMGLIYTSHKTTNDHTGPSNAIRLFANWLVAENFRRNPSKGLQTPHKTDEIRISSDSSPEDWQLFWEGKFLENPSIISNEDSQDYFSKQAHLPYGMRLEDNLSPQELMDWAIPLPLRPSSGARVMVPSPVVNVTYDDIKALSEMRISLRRPSLPIPSRPSSETLKFQFPALLRAAESDEPALRRLAEEQFHAMRFDPDNQTFSLILAAALAQKENPYASQVLGCANGIIASWLTEDRIENGRKALQTNLGHFAASVPHMSLQSDPPPSVAPIKLLPSFRPITLAKEPPKPSSLSYITSHSSLDIPSLRRFYSSAFTSVQGFFEKAVKPFRFETDDPWLQKSIQELNEDFLAGAKKNQAAPKYLLNKTQTVESLLKVHQKISENAAHYSKESAKKQEMAIIKIANRPPSDKKDALKYDADIASGHKKALDIRDCVGLFLQSDTEAYRRATHLQSEDEIAAFHNKIGDYILYCNKVNQCREVLKAYEQLGKVYHSTHSQDELDYALQRLAESLNASTDYASRLKQFQKDKSSSSSAHADFNFGALLVFEYVLNLTLRNHQVEGIKEMTQASDNAKTHFRSILLQRIQGGGKTLVFGHIMALLKADGYHLSVHVPTTPQYKTALYDMRERSEQLFGQREQTIVFDDDPAKFTSEYLIWMKQMLTESIVRREYVTLTNETLRALRCKYIKTRFEMMHPSPGTNVGALKKSNQLLKEILHLLRTRGIFTFDEMHKTFDPHKELNMPYGQPEKPNHMESQLIAEILRYACLATNDKGEPLLDLVNSSRQTAEQAAAMKGWIVDKLIKKPEWNDLEIKSYLNGSVVDIPAYLDKPEHHDLMRLVILARQMLVGNWLQQRLGLNVNEHHGVPQKEALDGSARVSIPFIANMKPAYGSEFSDRYVMTTNTLIAYLANGLSRQQTKELVESCRERANAEKIGLKEKNPSCTVRDTEISKLFFKALSMDLFGIDLEKEEHVRRVQQALLGRNAEAMQLMLDYVIEKEIGKVEIYENQVCSNGQNEASMCQSFVAYSGSMENLNMAPVGSVKKPEKGTNGQTIDLLIQQKTEVHLVDDQVSSLFDMMKSCGKSLHAIIDVGAYFRGKDNKTAAQMICKYLQEAKSEIQGVLFFDDATDDLCFMQRNPPYGFKTLSGTTPEAIEAETGFSKAQLFTYYDQDHMTGVDISQDEKAAAVMTFSQHTQIHEVLQGARRLRQLDLQQRIVVALPKSAVPKIGATLGKTYPDGKAPTIKQLLLFAHIREAMGQKGENLLYAMQKLENTIQQHILDKLYLLDEQQEQDFFEKASSLFEKSVAIDLYKEYAYKRKTEKIITYFNAIKEALLAPLIPFLPKEEIQALRALIDKEILNKDAYAGMQSDIEVHAGFSTDKGQTASLQNREASHIRTKQQVNVNDKLDVKEQDNLNEYLNEIESRRVGSNYPEKDIAFSKEDFFSKEFAIPVDILNLEYKKAHCWTLNSALRFGNSSPSKPNCLFEEGFLTSSNAAVSRYHQIDLLGPYRKKPWPLLVIRDEQPNGKIEWKVMLCSIADGRNFENLLTLNDAKHMEGRQMWLVRGNGKMLAGRRALNIDSDPKLSLLMTQALFFAGEFQTLSYSPWKARIEKWFGSLNESERKEWVNYFEKEILMGNPPGYKSSPLHRLFHQQFS